ncbi:ankyrin repeat-containing domain protein, partial [Sphaerosporella brunnea]
HEATVRLLFHRGADPHTQDKEHWTALHHASANGHEAIVQLLLDHGADIKANDPRGQSALAIASIWKCTAIEDLLARG